MSIPRPEFPRPDFERKNWINLNGVWEFEFDDYDLGESEKWFLGKDFSRKIVVPYPYQSKLSGINDPMPHDIVWYKRKFCVPEEYLSKRVLLKFRAVDYEAKVWVNGKYVGFHRGGYSPFYFDVTDVIREENTLVIRVVDRHGDQPRGKQDA